MYQTFDGTNAEPTPDQMACAVACAAIASNSSVNVVTLPNGAEHRIPLNEASFHGNRSLYGDSQALSYCKAIAKDVAAHIAADTDNPNVARVARLVANDDARIERAAEALHGFWIVDEQLIKRAFALLGAWDANDRLAALVDETLRLFTMRREFIASAKDHPVIGVDHDENCPLHVKPNAPGGGEIN